MKLLIGLILGFTLASSVSIAQEIINEWDYPIMQPNPQVLIPMPIYPAPIFPYQTPYSLPPMPEPHWQSINPC